MTNDELKKKIKEILRKRMTELLGSCHTDEIPLTEEGAEAILFYADEFADALIAAGIGDVKEIKYRVRRAEKALYIACRETAEIIFKDDFDRHAQEYMYGYLKQAEKEPSEEGKE